MMIRETRAPRLSRQSTSSRYASSFGQQHPLTYYWAVKTHVMTTEVKQSLLISDAAIVDPLSRMNSSFSVVWIDEEC